MHHTIPTDKFLGLSVASYCPECLRSFPPNSTLDKAVFLCQRTENNVYMLVKGEYNFQANRADDFWLPVWDGDRKFVW